MADISDELAAEMEAPDVPSDTGISAELAAELAAPVEAPVAPAASMPTPAPLSARVNVLNAQGELENIPRALIDTAYGQGFRLHPSEAPTEGVVRLLEQDRINTYDAKDPTLADRFAQGAQLATPDEIEREFGDLGSQVAAGLEGAAQGATMGGYGYIAGKVAGPTYTADLDTREETNPVTALSGQLVGAAAPSLLSGGTGALATAARATPVGAVSTLSTRLGEALASKAAQAGLGAAGRIGAAVVTAGAEGAVDNATRTVLDDITHNVPLSAERMLDSALEGGVTGAGGGLLFGAGAEAIGAAGRGLDRLRSRGAKATQAADEAAAEAASAAAKVDDVPTRPRAEIDADIEAAHQRLAEADAQGNQQLVEEAEGALEALQREQENAVLKDAGVTTDTQIQASLELGPTPEVQGILARLDKELSKARNARELDLKFGDETSKLTRSITDRVDDLQRLRQNEVDPYIHRGQKPKAIKAALEREGTVWTLDQAERILRENEEGLKLIRELREQYALGDEVARRRLGPLKSAEEAIEGVQKRLTDLKGTGKGGKGALDRGAGISPSSPILRGSADAIADVFWAEDSLKSYLGSIAKKKGEQMTQAEAALQRLYMRKRAALQDPKLYGRELAEMQTVTNAIESKAIPAEQVFRSKFGVARGELGERAGEHGFDVLAEADPSKIKAFVARLTDSDSFKDEEAFVAGLMRHVELMETKAKYYPTPPKAVEQIVQAKQTVASIVEDLKGAKELAMRRDAARRLVQEGSPWQDVIRDLSAMPGGALVGTMVGTATSVARGVAAGVVKLAQGAVKQEQAIEGAARKASRTLLDRAADSAEKVRAGLRVGGTGIRANAVRRLAEGAQALQDPDSEESRSFAARLEELRRESPELADALQVKAQSRAEWILAHALTQPDDSDPFRPGRVKPVDPITARSRERYIQAAGDPVGTLKRMSESGRATPEELETLRALYPELYRRWGQGVVDDALKSKTPPTLSQRARLHYLTGIPVSREQQPEYLQAMAAMPVDPPQEEQGAQPKRGPKFTFADRESFGAASDRILSSTVDG